MKTSTFAIAAVSTISAVGLATVGAIYLGSAGEADAFEQCRETVIAGGGGSVGGPFTLVTETGEEVTEAEVLTTPSLIYFGYTFCPDVCPLDTVRNAEAVDILDSTGHDVLPVFITVDPNRDTPEVMAAFTNNVHERMLGLTGTQEQTDAAASAYRVYYQSHDNGSDPYYLVDHTAFTYLVLPEHGFVDFFHRDTTPTDMAARTACFVDAAS